MARTLPCIHLRAALLACLIGLAALSGGCDRSASPPIAPVQPIPARGPGPATPPPAAEPPPPPKEAPPDQPADAPSTPAAAAPQVEDKSEKLAGAEKPHRRVRDIHPTEPGKDCVEMYGTCTSGPDKVCTSSALYVDCGKRSQVPETGEWVQCVCR